MVVIDSMFGDRAKMTALIVTGMLVLLYASIGIDDSGTDGNKVLSAAYAQVPNDTAATSLLDNATNNTVTASVDTGIQNESSFLLRGLVGTTVTVQTSDIEENATSQQDDNYAITGRWRLFVNESLVERFAANLTMARTDGSEHHNFIIENIGRSPPFVGNSSIVTTQLYTNSTSPSTIANISLEIRDKVLVMTDIEIIDEAIEDVERQNILRIIDRQSIYGIVEFQGVG